SGVLRTDQKTRDRRGQCQTRYWTLVSSYLYVNRRPGSPKENRAFSIWIAPVQPFRSLEDTPETTKVVRTCSNEMYPREAHMSYLSLRAVLGTVAVFLLASVPAFSDSQVRAVRLSFVEGSVQITHGSSQDFEKAMANLPMIQGTR